MKMRSVALVEWNWEGHHPTYFNHFLLALEGLGMNVLAICPNPAEVEELVNQTRQGVSTDRVQRSRIQFKQIRVPALRFHNLRPRRIGSIDWTFRHFTGIEHQVLEWTREAGTHVDAILYACMYDRDFAWVKSVQPFLRLPWMGLYLHAMSYRMPGRFLPYTRRLPCPEKMFSGRLCMGVGTLDEGIVEQFSTAIGKPVVALPDVADERPAMTAEERVLGQHLRQFAAGRPIVGLFGHLQKSKGILTFLEAARMPGASRICFALAGDLLWPADQSEVLQIRIALEKAPNIWHHFQRIPSEPCLSDLIEACDVISAAYIDFPHSSGIQSKAAVLSKPLIVSDGYLMAERSRRYRMGEVVPQDNARALLEAVLRITKDPAAWVANNNPLWEDYRCDHSFDRFKACLKELLDTV